MVKVVGRRPGGSNVRSIKPKPNVSPLPPSRTPVPPSWFTSSLKREFAKVVSDMTSSGIEPLAVDTPIITSLVVAVATHAKAAHLVETEGVLTTGRDGSLVRNPSVIVVGQQARLIDSLSSSLGLTPASRQRLRAHQASLSESSVNQSPEEFFAM